MSERLTDAAEGNLLAFAEAWARASGGECRRRDGMLLASSGAPMRAFNVVIITEVKPALQTALCDAIASFRRRGVPFRVRFRDSLSPHAAEALANAGLELQGRLPCVGLSPPVASATPAPIDIRAVEDVRGLQDHVEVVADVFGWRPDDLAAVFTPRLMQDGRWRAYVAYAAGRPVAASQLMLNGGSAGIYYVGTAEAYRHQGIGEAVTQRAINDAARARCATVGLQASPMGFPLYERMGFRTIGAYDGYVLVEDL